MERDEMYPKPGLRLARVGHLATCRQVPLNNRTSPPLLLHPSDLPLTTVVTSSRERSTRSRMHRINSTSCLWHALLRWLLHSVASLLLVSSVPSTSKTLVIVFQDTAA